MNSAISDDEQVVRDRMRADLIESGDFGLTELYIRLAPTLSMRTLRRLKHETLDEYLAMRRSLPDSWEVLAVSVVR